MTPTADGTATLVVVAEATAMAGLGLAVMFAFAAGLKWRAGAETASEFSALGLPRPALLARWVPGFELALAAGLVLMPGVGGPLAVLALAGFTAVLVRALRSGRSVSCGCLGAFDRRPISLRTVARNLGLLVPALLVAAVGHPGAGTGRLHLAPLLPSPAAIVAIGTTAVILALVTQLVLLRRNIGRIWAVTPAGEPDRRPDRDHPAEIAISTPEVLPT